MDRCIGMSWADIQDLEDLEELKNAELQKTSIKKEPESNKELEKVKRPKKDRNTKTN